VAYLDRHRLSAAQTFGSFPKTWFCNLRKAAGGDAIQLVIGEGLGPVWVLVGFGP
jgi:hypothetical protein